MIEHGVLDELRADRSLKMSDLERGHAVSGALFHNSMHRYFVFTLRIALTSIKQLFSLIRVDG